MLSQVKVRMYTHQSDQDVAAFFLPFGTIKHIQKLEGDSKFQCFAVSYTDNQAASHAYQSLKETLDVSMKYVTFEQGIHLLPQEDIVTGASQERERDTKGLGLEERFELVSLIQSASLSRRDICNIMGYCISRSEIAAEECSSVVLSLLLVPDPATLTFQECTRGLFILSDLLYNSSLGEQKNASLFFSHLKPSLPQFFCMVLAPKIHGSKQSSSRMGKEGLDLVVCVSQSLYSFSITYIITSYLSLLHLLYIYNFSITYIITSNPLYYN